MNILLTLRYRWLLRKAKIMAKDLDWWETFSPVHITQLAERDLLEAKIVKLQNKLEVVARFDALLKEWFPKIAMEHLSSLGIKKTKIKV